MEVCRACLSSDKRMMPLSESFINGYNLLTNISVKHLDGLPQHACETCVNSVNCFVDFREQCIQSESSLQEQLLKNIKCEPEECDNNQGSPESSLGNNFDSPPKQESFPKRPRGRPRKVVTASETERQSHGHYRKNETFIPEVEKTDNPSLENLNSKELSLSQLEQNDDLDLIKEECEYEYFEICDDDLESRLKDFAVASEPNILDILPAKCKPNVPKLPRKKKPQKKLKTIKDSAVNESDFPCGLCEKHFETQRSLSSHLEDHKNDSNCETCKVPFTEWQALLAHRIKHVQNKYHCCHLCPKRLHAVESLEYHYLENHSNKNVQDITIQCKLCMKSFSTLKNLRKHISIVHSKKEYTCDYCSKSLSSRNAMKIHWLQHSNVKKFKCDTCGDSFKQSSSLRAHIWRKHTATRVYCPCCHRVYPNEEALQKHVCPQTEKICPVCGKVFIRADRMSKHMESHGVGAKHKCDECPAEFRSRRALVTHTDRHRDRRRHACPLCPKRFYSACLLVRHKRIHTGERPYVCKVCSKAFNSSYNLKFHMRVHGEYLVARRNKTSDDDNAFQP